MSPGKVTSKEKLNRLIYFFPVQLLFLYLKRRHFTLLIWLVLFLIINSAFASKYGVHLLLLYPEYLSEVNILSHLILGISVGGFIMSFHISSYIINGYRFPFIATLSKPFYKYSINNSLIPFLFLLNYCWALFQYQKNVELLEPLQILQHILAVLGGAAIFMTLCFSYFLSTNLNIVSLSSKASRKRKQKERGGGASQFFGKSTNWYRLMRFSEEGFRTKTYLSDLFKVELARSSKHYEVKTLMRVLSQNRMNATFFELAVLITIFILGFFIEKSIYLVPSGASILLIFTMFMIISSALHSWFKGWSTAVFIVLALIINYTSQFTEFNYRSMALGLKYDGVLIPYDEQAIQAHFKDWQKASETLEAERRVLSRWYANQNQKKPKLIFVNVSGGGLRSGLWTYAVLNSLDTILDQRFLDKVHLISGSSGGMLGAAYYREQKLIGQSIAPDSSYALLSKDLLNPVAFTLAINDIFPRWRKVEDQGESYLLDRGYAFEEQLNQNLDGLLNKRLKDYAAVEYSAKTPTMLFTPTINNDGRRLIVASRPMVFMSAKRFEEKVFEQAEAIDFLSYFDPASPGNTRLSSIIRMSATFPYVMPNISLPTIPEVEIADAGLRDNFGFLGTSKYIVALKDWIEKNTSGVIVVQIKDSPSNIKIRENARSTLLRGLSSPLGGFYSNWLNIQQYNQESMANILKSEMEVPIHMVSFELEHGKDRISLSWHLTKKEKQRIINSIGTEHNRVERNRLKNFLEVAKTKS